MGSGFRGSAFRGQKPDDRIQRRIEDRGQKLDFFYMLYALCPLPYALCSMPFIPATRNLKLATRNP
jgi:hypothetical protein